MGSLIDFSALSDGFIHLLDKLEKFGCYLVNPKGSEKDAIESFIKSVEASDIDPIKKAAMIRESRSIIRKYKNKNDIYKIALEELSQNPENVTEENLEKVDDEWLSRFSDSAQHVSDEEFQIIWGKILAEEIQHPNSISKSLIHILSIIDKDEAEMFSILCDHTIFLDNYPYLFCDFNKSTDYWKNLGLHLAKLIYIQGIGLINNEKLGYNIQLDSPIACLSFRMGNNNLFEVKKEQNFSKFGLGDYFFTKSGVSLCKALKKSPSQSCIDHIVNSLSKDGFIVTSNSVKE